MGPLLTAQRAGWEEMEAPLPQYKISIVGSRSKGRTKKKAGEPFEVLRYSSVFLLFPAKV